MKIKVKDNNGCGYEVYPAGTDLNIGKELNAIRGVYISKAGYIYYTIYNDEKLYSEKFIEKLILTKVKTK